MPVLDHELDEVFRRAATKYSEQPTEGSWLRVAARLPGSGNLTRAKVFDWHLVDKPAPFMGQLTRENGKAAT